MITTKEGKIVSDLFYLLDSNVRSDLQNNRIADERDYVSRIVTNFNYPFGIFNKYYINGIKFQSKWFARVNSGYYEQEFGCDSMLLFKVGNKIKIGLFEAKWPRVIKDPNYSWDYIQKSNKKSHFTDQIRRQSIWTDRAAIWEMFFYEQKVGVLNKPFDRNASTCIRHLSAKNMIKNNPSLQKIWNNDDLKNLISLEQTSAFDGSNETNLKHTVFDILTCKFGKAFAVQPTDSSFILTSNDNEKTAIIPFITFFDNNDDTQTIQQFMEENGLSFFQQLNIMTPENRK